MPHRCESEFQFQSCVSLGKLLYLTEFQFACLKYVDNSSYLKFLLIINWDYIASEDHSKHSKNANFKKKQYYEAKNEFK